MTYRVYSSPQGVPEPSPIERQTMLYKEFLSLDEAMWFAGHLQKQGRVAFAIDGDDGTHLDRRAIADAMSVHFAKSA